MSLRQRIVLSLVVITVILVVPAVYGANSLRELQRVARDLRFRDAVGALALGRMQGALSEVEQEERIYLALGSQFPEEAASARLQVEAGMRRVAEELERLRAAGYGSEISVAVERWNTLAQALREQHALIETGQINAADEFRGATLDPAFAAANAALEPVGVAINRGSTASVRRAQDIARRAATTSALALAVALTLTVLIGGWLTRTLLRPIHELRRAMSVVAEGEFEGQARLSTGRSDELGDLARSFQSMTRQLAELDRLKAEFVSVASHEIKTPLSVIRGYVSLLQDGIYGQVSDAQKKVLDSVSDQTERLTRLVHRLLDISRFEAGGGRLELREISAREFLQELTTGFDVLAYQNEIDFELKVDERLPPTFVCDPDRLNEVLGNLLSNAFKFTPRGGRIELRAHPGPETIVVEVSDNGVGIPSDKLPNIFDKFFQVENAAQPRSVGSGLGLAIAQEIVAAHGGTISAESEVGQGTTFRMVVPLHPPTPHTA